MFVRLTVKLADVVNGVDLAPYSEGDIIELPAREAAMLIAEGWAEQTPAAEMPTASSAWSDTRAVAADRPRRLRKRRA